MGFRGWGSMLVEDARVSTILLWVIVCFNYIPFQQGLCNTVGFTCAGSTKLEVTRGPVFSTTPKMTL